MSAREIVSPVYRVECDWQEGCRATFTPDSALSRSSDRAARNAAERAGWQVRPFLGKGSRTGPDLCPQHAKDVA